MPMGDEEKLKIIIEAHNKAKAAFDEAQKQIDDTTAKVSTMRDKMHSAGEKMKAVGGKMTKYMTLPILAGAGVSIKAFSDLQETINKVDVSFGGSAGVVKKWSESSIKSMGLAQQSALDAAALFGDMGTGMGQNQEEASKMSMGLTQLGADMASFKNVSIDRAQTALAGVYTGETEALKSLGVVMTETNLQEFAASKGITKKISQMTQAEKVQLRYNFVMDKTANAQGDFARTSDSIANKTRTASEKTKQLSAELGGKLAPIYQKLLEVGTKVLDWFGNLSDKWQKWIVYIGIALAILGPLVSIVGTLATVLSAVFSPIGLIVAGIALLIAGLVYAYFHFETFRNIVDTVFNAIATAAVWLFDTILKPIWDGLVWTFTNVLVPVFKFLGEVVKAVWGGISKAIETAWGFIKPIWDVLYWYVTNIAIPMWKVIWEVVKAVWGGISKAIETAWGFIKPIWDAIWKFVEEKLIPQWKAFLEAVKVAWNWLSENVGPIVDNVVGYISRMIEGIKEALRFLGILDDEKKKAGSKTVTGYKVDTGPVTAAGKKFTQLGANASGGWTQAGVGGLVGEEGPELFVPSRSGQIIDAKRTAALMSQAMSGGSGTSLVVHGNITFEDKSSVDSFFSRLNMMGQLSELGIPV